MSRSKAMRSFLSAITAAFALAVGAMLLAGSLYPQQGQTAQVESNLQNETCNGPQPCAFRGVSVNAGTIAFASGALSHCPQGCDGDFRVASITLCAVAGGHAEIAFQFAPPAPSTRDTEIVVVNGDLIQDRTRYQSYVINVTGPTATPGPPTWTPGAIPTITACNMNFT